MKQQLHYFILFLVGIGFASCSKDNDFPFQNDYDLSYNQWLKFKADNGDSYYYVVNNDSWVGTSWETTITVNEGKVIRRSFKLSSSQGTDQIPQEARAWTEEANAINTHEYSGAAGAFTLDQIYEKARTEWLQKRSKAQNYFEAKNNGLLSTCGYTEDGCMDDCFVGIRITSIKPIEEPCK